jgi:Lipocalin-like domain
MSKFPALVTTLAVGTAAAMHAQARPTPLIGTWQVVSRVDRDSAGHVTIEPVLGRQPRGYLIYDAAGHVAAQLMAPQRPASACRTPGATDPNNSTYLCAYDAYFGRYEIDEATGTVVHILDGALVPTDVGRRLTRRFRVAQDTLTIQFEVRGPDGRQLTRTMTWHRISS